MSVVRQGVHAVIAVVVVTALVAGVVLLVENADGAFNGDYQVVASFPSAGQGLHTGSEVDYRGVEVGTVTSIGLSGGRARVVLDLQPSFHFPADATATVRPQNLFGAEEVAVTSPDGQGGPWLSPGASVAHTATADQIDDLFATADPLLEQIDTTDLSSTIGELNQATDGQGGQIASGLGEGAKLATLLSNTLGAQITALNSLNALSVALVPSAAGLNQVARQANTALPAINAAQADFQHLLDTLTPLARNVAQFLSLYRPDIGQLLASGANVTRVLLTHESDIQSLIRGAYQYVTRLGAVSGATLPDGSTYAYFQTFIQFDDVNDLVCSLIAPAAPGLAALVPLQQALSSSGSPFDCASQETSFNTINPAAAGQPASTPAATPAAAATSTTSPTSPTSPTSATSAGSTVAGQIYQTIGSPAAPQAQSLNGYVQMLLGGL